MMPNLERERGVQRRFLYIDATMVTPDQDSGSVRVQGVLKTTREHGCKVTFIADNLEYKSPYVEDLQQLGVEVRYWPELRSIEDYLEQEGAFFDVIVLSRYYVAEKHIAAVRKHAPQALVALDTHDLHYLRLRRLAELEPSAAHTRAAEEAYAKEMAIMQACDVTLVVSPVEQDLLAKEQPGLDVRVFTNIHEVADRVPPHAGRSGMMFVGGYRHPPNIDAVLWYAKEVLPLVKQRLPGIKTYIIGSNAPAEITDLADEALEIVGFVPDMTPYLESVRVSISPLRYGAGVKGKINQAMAHGLPVVGTSPSVEGMFLRDGVEVLVADTPEEFASAIERLHNDAELWDRLSQASLDNVRTYFSAEAAWQVIDGMMADADRRRQR
jgi:glycosyltransferase involved in cell wall biosynthesis